MVQSLKFPYQLTKTSTKKGKCIGKQSFLCGNLRECQALVSKIRNVDVPQPENLLGELVDVVERVNQVSSSLLSNTEEVLAQISAQEKVIEEVSKFVPIDRYPGCRRPILTDKDKVYQTKCVPTSTW